MGKTVAKYRRDRFSEDDYEVKDSKRKRNEHTSLRKLKNYSLDQLVDEYEQSAKFETAKFKRAH